MKTVIDGIIVVEGVTDVAFLSSFIDAEFVITNGSEIPENTIEYLIKSSGNRDIFVLTDPDYPGQRIRAILDQRIPNLKHCFISKEKSIKHNKVGVAESTKQEILTALSKHITSSKNNIGSITQTDLFRLGLLGNEDSSFKRDVISQKLHLGHCNGKTFLKRINSSGITLKDIESCL